MRHPRRGQRQTPSAGRVRWLCCGRASLMRAHSLRSSRRCNEKSAPAVVATWTTVPLSLTPARSEEHTSELQSLTNLVCRLLLEKKKDNTTNNHHCQTQTTQ